MSPDSLFCVCGREVRIVRLGRSTLALGHTQNPRNHRHPVQLARAARNAVPAATGLREGLHVSEDAQPLTPDRRSPRAGRVVPDVSMPVISSSARGGRVAAETPPAPAPRSPRAG